MKPHAKLLTALLAVVLGGASCGSSSSEGTGGSGGGGAGGTGGAPATGGAPGTGGTTATGGSSGSGGSPDAGAADTGSTSSSDFGIFATNGTEMIALTEGATATNGQSSATVMASFTNGGTMLPKSMTLSILANGAIGPGTFECSKGGAGVGYAPMFGMGYVASMSQGSCTIIATSVGKNAGEITEGTFTATLVPSMGGGANITITNGRFKAKIK